MPSPEEEAGASLLGKKSSKLGGVHSSKVAEAKASLKVDGQGVTKLDGEFGVLRRTIDTITSAFDRMTSSAGRAHSAANGAANAGAGARGTARNGMANPPPAPQSPVKGTPFSPPVPGTAAAPTGPRSVQGGIGGILGRGGAHLRGGPLGGATGGAIVGAAIAGQVAGSMVGALDSRVNRGMDYAMGADRMNMVMQQQTGKTQMQVMEQMRQPLAKQRLGAGGINAMLQFQTQTGMQATPQIAQSIAGIRALSGYSKTTADVLTDQRSLMDPTVANRMFSMLGTNAYNIGGGAKDPLAMRQSVVSSMGLANEDLLRGASTLGSGVRVRLADAGIGQEMQDEFIGYAKSQVQYKKKGGQGMYNPGNKEHRELMGVEDNFASQAEETDSKRTQREEQFMERQIDNYASLEKNTQAMVGILGSIEDKMSSLIGARTSSRGWQKVGGRLIQAAGIGVMAMSAGAGAPIGAAMVVGGGAMAGGDPDGGGAGATGTPAGGSGTASSANDGNVSIPVGYGGGRATLNEVKQRSDFQRMNPKMQDRLLRMFRENPNVGIGGGYRDSAAQEAMFRQRYRPTDKDTGIKWQGQNWEHVSGAAAAPPGRSMHEIGLAADLVGDIGWMNANATRFGLKHFAGVNDEPWHVQPSELPNSRREYEGGGAAWGSDNYFAEEPSDGASKPVTGASDEHSAEHGGGSSGRGMVSGYGGMSISQIVDSVKGGTAGFRGGGPRGGGPGGRSTKTKKSSGSGASDSLPISGRGAELAARAAYNAGFRGEDLFKIVSIAGRESGFDPNAINKSSRDTGMWQIAPMNWGSYSQEDLLDPANNAAAAFRLFKGSGFHGWKAANSRMKNSAGHWVVDPSGKGGAGWASDGNELWKTESHQATARVAVESITGDPAGGGSRAPVMQHRGPSSAMQTPLVMSPTYNISVAPVIQFQGGGSSPSHSDLKKMAQTVGVMLKEEVRTLSLRTE